MTPTADVYQGSALVAYLDRTPRGIALSFIPEAPLDHGFLSTTLRPAPDVIETQDLHPFFLNLLPEGERLRLLLEASRSKDDSLALLLKLGWDTIGDVAVLPHGDSLLAHSVSVPQSDLGEVSFWDLFYQGIGERADASVPGVQEKISSSTIAFGLKTASIPSAILKLNPKTFPRLVQNEEFFLRMANACGLHVNKATLVHDRDGESGLLVTRFDRVKEGKAILKLHQEDACQLLNTVPAHKYEIPLRTIAEAISKVCTAPIVEIARLLQLYAFSYLVGNCDLHAKNISVLWTETTGLSPAYDILSTLPYPLDRKMALSMDGRDDNFRAAHFVAFGQRYGVPEKATRSTLERLCQRARPWLDRLEEIGFDAKTTTETRREISSRMEKILR